MFKVKAVKEVSTFKVGPIYTVLEVCMDGNGQPKLLVADGSGILWFKDSELFRYVEEKKPAAKRQPAKKKSNQS